MIIIKGMYEILMLPKIPLVHHYSLTKKYCLGARIKSTDSTKFERRACWREAGRKGKWSQRGPRTKRSSSWCCEQYSSSYARHAFQYISLTFAASSTFIYAVLKCNWQLIGSEKKINILATFFTPLLSLLLKAVWLDFLKEYTSQVWAFTTYALTKISGKDYHICTE